MREKRARARMHMLTKHLGRFEAEFSGDIVTFILQVGLLVSVSSAALDEFEIYTSHLL